MRTFLANLKIILDINKSLPTKGIPTGWIKLQWTNFLKSKLEHLRVTPFYVKAIRLWNLYSAQTLIYFEVNSTFARINRLYSIAIIYITSFFCLCIKNGKVVSNHLNKIIWILIGILIKWYVISIISNAQQFSFSFLTLWNVSDFYQNIIFSWKILYHFWMMISISLWYKCCNYEEIFQKDN